MARPIRDEPTATARAGDPLRAQSRFSDGYDWIERGTQALAKAGADIEAVIADRQARQDRLADGVKIAEALSQARTRADEQIRKLDPRAPDYAARVEQILDNERGRLAGMSFATSEGRSQAEVGLAGLRGQTMISAFAQRERALIDQARQQAGEALNRAVAAVAAEQNPGQAMLTLEADLSPILSAVDPEVSTAILRQAQQTLAGQAVQTLIDRRDFRGAEAMLRSYGQQGLLSPNDVKIVRSGIERGRIEEAREARQEELFREARLREMILLAPDAGTARRELDHARQNRLIRPEYLDVLERRIDRMAEKEREEAFARREAAFLARIDGLPPDQMNEVVGEAVRTGEIRKGGAVHARLVAEYSRMVRANKERFEASQLRDMAAAQRVEFKMAMGSPLSDDEQFDLVSRRMQDAAARAQAEARSRGVTDEAELRRAGDLAAVQARDRALREMLAQLPTSLPHMMRSEFARAFSSPSVDAQAAAVARFVELTRIGRDDIAPAAHAFLNDYPRMFDAFTTLRNRREDITAENLSRVLRTGLQPSDIRDAETRWEKLGKDPRAEAAKAVDNAFRAMSPAVSDPTGRLRDRAIAATREVFIHEGLGLEEAARRAAVTTVRAFQPNPAFVANGRAEAARVHPMFLPQNAIPRSLRDEYPNAAAQTLNRALQEFLVEQVLRGMVRHPPPEGLHFQPKDLDANIPADSRLATLTRYLPPGATINPTTVYGPDGTPAGIQMEIRPTRFSAPVLATDENGAPLIFRSEDLPGLLRPYLDRLRNATLEKAGEGLSFEGRLRQDLRQFLERLRGGSQ